jgi:hypothetical protein
VVSRPSSGSRPATKRDQQDCVARSWAQGIEPAPERIFATFRFTTARDTGSSTH